jgi:hypothetical protein
MTRLSVSLRGLNTRVQRLTVQEAVVCAWVVDAHRRGEHLPVRGVVELTGMARDTVNDVVGRLVRREFLELRAVSTGKGGTRPHVLRATPKLLRWFEEA